MNGDTTQQQVFRNVYNYPVSTTKHPEPLNFKLLSQQQAIKSIAINNPKNLGLTIQVFGGPSSAGSPIFVCLPGKSARIPIEGNYPLHIKFIGAGPQGTPLADGYVFIAVTSEMGPEIFTPDSVGVDGSIDIGTMPNVVIDTIGTSLIGPLDVHIVSGVTLGSIDVNPVPPANAFRVIQYFAPQQFQSGTARIQIDAGPGVGHTLYLTNIRISGLDVQPYLEWRFQTLNVGGNTYTLLIRGYGDVIMFPPFTFNKQMGGSIAQGLYFDFVNNAAILGVIHFDLYVAGYYL